MACACSAATTTVIVVGTIAVTVTVTVILIVTALFVVLQLLSGELNGTIRPAKRINFLAAIFGCH